MAKSNVYTFIGIAFVALLGIFGFWMIGKGKDCTGDKCSSYAYMGWFAVGFAVLVMIYLYLRDRQRQKIPFPKIKQAYIELMDQKERISINPLAETFKLTEEGERYVFVLRDYCDDIPHYYMCEADVYTGNFGRGFGQWTTSQVEAEYWYQTRKKLDIAQIMNNELQRQAVREMALKSKQQELMLSRMQSGNAANPEFR